MFIEIALCIWVGGICAFLIYQWFKKGPKEKEKPTRAKRRRNWRKSWSKF